MLWYRLFCDKIGHESQDVECCRTQITQRAPGQRPHSEDKVDPVVLDSMPPCPPRLVFDVLSVIFQIALEARSNSPWPLAQVDRHWRDTAFSTPSLWTSLTVTGLSRSRQRYCEGSEICNTPPRLHMALMRAGASPLDLKIDLFIDGLDNASKSVLVDMLAIISGTKDQWRSIECTVGCHPWREFPLFRGPFPRLILLSWKDSTTFEDAQKRPLDVTYHPPSQLLALVFSESPSLVEISFSQTIVDRWFGDGAFKRHPTFNTWQSHFEGTLANLRTLHLTMVEPPSGVSRPPICAPNLDTLILHNCGTYLLRHFAIPSLRHLKISRGRRRFGRSDLRLVLPGFWTARQHRCERPPSLLSLRLEEQDIGVASLLLLLRSSPELECLQLVYCLIKDSDKLFSRIEEDALCLCLREIDFRERWRRTEGNYELSDIYKFVETRASLPHRTPLKRALYSNSIIYESNTKAQDLVQNLQAWKRLEPIL